MSLPVVGFVPSPGLLAGAPLKNAFSINIGHDIGITSHQGLGGAHSGTKRNFAFGNPVLTVKSPFFLTEVFLRSTRTKCALIHGTAGTKDLPFRKLWCAKRAGHKTIATADADLFIDQHDTVIPLINGIHRTDRHARRIRTMHAGNGNRPLSRLALIQGHHTSAIDTHGDMIPFFTGDDTPAAIDATINIAQKFHPCHCHILLSGLAYFAQTVLGGLHLRDDVIAIVGDDIPRLTKGIGNCAFRILLGK